MTRARIEAVAIAAALLALVVWTAHQRWSVLAESPFPVGIDGYFYPIQLRSLLATGHLAYGDFPVAYWLMAPFAAATDPLTGAKLAAAVYLALAVLPAYVLGARLGNARGAGLVSAAIVATSAGSTFLALEFVKNGIGMTLALTALWLVLRAADAPTRTRLVLAGSAVLLALATHKLAGAFALAGALPTTVGAIADRGKLRGRRLLYAIGGVTAVLLGSAVYAAGSLIAHVFSSTMHLSAPALVRGDRVLLAMGHEPLIGAVVAWCALVVMHTRLSPTLARPARIVAWLVILLATAIAFPWLDVADPQGLALRLRVVAFIPLALCAAIVCGALRGRAQLPVLAALALAIVVAAPQRRVEGRIVAHPAMVAAVQALTGDVPANGVVIVPERHIMFMIAWYTRLPVRLTPDVVPPQQRWRVMPLAFIGAGSALDQVLVEARREPSLTPPIGLHPSHANGLVLVPEATWTWVLEQLPADARAHYAAWPTI